MDSVGGGLRALRHKERELSSVSQSDSVMGGFIIGTMTSTAEASLQGQLIRPYGSQQRQKRKLLVSIRRIVFNQKGGVGKTSITCNLAAISAALGHRTLVVDLDVHGNTTEYLTQGLDTSAFPEEARGVAAMFGNSVGAKRQRVSADTFVWEVPYDNLYLMPSSPQLATLERELEVKHKIFKLREALAELEGVYDRVYIDTPPSFNFYTKSALVAANRLLVPFDCDSFARSMIDSLMENVEELKEDLNPDLLFEGIIINQFNSRAKLPQAMVEGMRADGLRVLSSYLSSSVKMRESHASHRPLVDLAPSHKLTQEFVALYQELEQM